MSLCRCPKTCVNDCCDPFDNNVQYVDMDIWSLTPPLNRYFSVTHVVVKCLVVQRSVIHVVSSIQYHDIASRY